MLKQIIGAVFSVLLSGGTAMATCSSLPNNLTNGNPADATQVMANFNCAALLGAANNFSGSIGIGVVPSHPFDITIQTGSSFMANFAKVQTTNDYGFYLVFSGGITGTTSRGVIGGTHTGSGPDTILPGENADGLAMYSQQSLNFGTNGNLLAATMDTSGHFGVAALGAGTATTLCYNTGTISGLDALATCSSDARLKKNIRPILGRDAIKMVNTVQPVSYNWNPVFSSDQSAHDGFTAQSVQRILPGSVAKGEATSLTPDGTLTRPEDQELVAVLWAAVQEQQKEIDDLKRQIQRK